MHPFPPEFMPEAMRDVHPEVSIVIPCRNEADTIGACVREAWQAVAAGGYAAEVLVVDNGSTDFTVEEAERAGARVITQTVRGYGAAVLRGLEVARGEVILIADGDGTYDLTAMHRFVEPVRSGCDLVIGTRRNGAMLPRAMRPSHRHFWEPMQTFLSRHFLHFTVSDVRCGMRAISRTALDKLRLGAVGMEFASEMILEAARADLSVMEVPVEFRPRASGDSRRSAGDGWRVARQLLLLSPTRVFMLPGLVLLALGLILEIALLPGPVRVAGFNIDFHFLFIGGALAILGLQLVLLAVYAKTYALVHDAGPTDPWIRRLHLHYSLERGVALGGLVFGAGLIINVWILASWLAQGRGGDLFAVRPAMLALTLMVLGAEIVFAAVFLSVLRGSRFGRA